MASYSSWCCANSRFDNAALYSYIIKDLLANATHLMNYAHMFVVFSTAVIKVLSPADSCEKH